MNMPDGPDGLSVAFRAISFALLLNAAGIAIFSAGFARYVPNSLPTVRRLGWKLAVGAMFFVAAHQALEAARMAGEMSGVMDPDMQLLALRSTGGAAFAARMIGLAFVAVGLWRGAKPAVSAAVAGAILAVSSFTLTGHTSVSPYRPAAAALLSIHLLVIAFWLGALWPLYLATSREQPAAAGRLIGAFSAVAAWLVPVILLAGLGLTVMLVPNLSVFRQPYGQVLLAKIALFGVLMGLAAFNKWKLGPAAGDGHSRAVRALRRTIAIEYGLICIVLALTAVMTTFYSPEAA